MRGVKLPRDWQTVGRGRGGMLVNAKHGESPMRISTQFCGTCGASFAVSTRSPYDEDRCTICEPAYRWTMVQRMANLPTEPARETR